MSLETELAALSGIPDLSTVNEALQVLIDQYGEAEVKTLIDKVVSDFAAGITATPPVSTLTGGTASELAVYDFILNETTDVQIRDAMLSVLRYAQGAISRPSQYNWVQFMAKMEVLVLAIKREFPGLGEDSDPFGIQFISANFYTGEEVVMANNRALRKESFMIVQDSVRTPRAFA